TGFTARDIDQAKSGLVRQRTAEHQGVLAGREITWATTGRAHLVSGGVIDAPKLNAPVGRDEVNLVQACGRDVKQAATVGRAGVRHDAVRLWAYRHAANRVRDPEQSPLVRRSASVRHGHDGAIGSRTTQRAVTAPLADERAVAVVDVRVVVRSIHEA